MQSAGPQLAGLRLRLTLTETKKHRLQSEVLLLCKQTHIQFVQFSLHFSSPLGDAALTFVLEPKKGVG